MRFGLVIWAVFYTLTSSLLWSPLNKTCRFRGHEDSPDAVVYELNDADVHRAIGFNGVAGPQGARELAPIGRRSHRDTSARLTGSAVMSSHDAVFTFVDADFPRRVGKEKAWMAARLSKAEIVVPSASAID
jgi:hypothetical protein